VDKSMYIVAITDNTWELRIYEYPCEILREAEQFYNSEQFNSLLIEVINGKETILKRR